MRMPPVSITTPSMSGSTAERPDAAPMHPNATARFAPRYMSGMSPTNRGDEEARAETHEHAPHPDEHGHVRGEGKRELACRAEQGTRTEGLLPADDRAHEPARDHKGTADERVDHVRKLYLRRRGMELGGKGGGGERQGAVVARGAHLRQDENDDGNDEELLAAGGCRACGRG